MRAKIGTSEEEPTRMIYRDSSAASRHESLFDAEETQRIFRCYSRDVLDGLIADLRDGREHVREQTRLVPSRAQLGGTNAPRRQVGCISFYHDAIVGNSNSTSTDVTLDVSADLEEFTKSPVAVVCALNQTPAW